MLRGEAEKLAIMVFEGTKYRPSTEDIEKLSGNILLLEEAGLGKLNKRLLEGGRKVWDTLIEHNLAAELILPGVIRKIAYEPKDFSPPPDFRIEKDNFTYWVQVKNLARLERENRQTKIFAKIRRCVETIPAPKFFQVLLSLDFDESEVQDLQRFIGEKAKESIDDQEYAYPDSTNPKAKITFWSPQKASLQRLTLGISGDMEMAELTGLAEKQIKGSLLNAAIAFKWKSDQTTINLIVLDADKQYDINICEALYGTEFEIISRDRHAWSREKDGLFHDQDFSSKVAGVIALRRKENWRPLSQYNKTLYINETFRNRIEHIQRLLSFGKLVRFNMRPKGKANF
jgi:hypothetical protein